MYYNNYLKSNHWKETKDFFKYTETQECFVCANFKKLHVHHLKYGTIGYEDGSELIYLCNGCHFHFHFPEGKDKPQRLMNTEQEIITGLRNLIRNMAKTRRRLELPLVPDGYNSPLKLLNHITDKYKKPTKMKKSKVARRDRRQKTTDKGRQLYRELVLSVRMDNK